ncbi:MAG: complex I NDUFA9 subunit family protein [Burkholderiaceae bacterium]|nr:complex I NDUFA9 subunit family protein [Burkholderiaceae bacterium]
MRHHRILVCGGGGFIGRYVVDRLAARVASVVVPTRRRDRVKQLIVLPTAEVVDADVHDPVVLGRLIADCDAVINLVGILHGNYPPAANAPYGSRFLQAHVELPRRIVASCEKHGVRRLLHVSALGADSKGPSMYLRSKGDGERVVQSSSTVETTIFRPSVVFGRDDRFLNLFARMAPWMPVMAVGRPEARFQPIWVGDVASAIVNSLDELETHGRTYELCGPGIYTLGDLVRFASRASGHPRPVIGLPDSVAKAMAWVFEHLLGEPVMSRDNLDSLSVDCIASRQPYWPAPELGVRPTPMEPEAMLYLAGLHPRTRYSGFRARARR